MLSPFYIKNYRNLKELYLDSLGQINLISGKNNTGKSSLLEAISIYANKGSVDSIIANLHDRKEYVARRVQLISSTDEILQENINALSSLFINRHYSFSSDDKIEIGRPDLNDLITLRFVHYKEIAERNEKNRLISLEQIIVDNKGNNNLNDDLSVGFEIKAGDHSELLTLKQDLSTYMRTSSPVLSGNNQFIHTNNINREINSLLFDRIALSDKEKYVIEALKIIEPNTERIAFVDNSRKERIAVIKLSNANDIIPLSSMGDGINRILTIILALVNSSDGYLLIDEFENGLHYTIQEQLWTIIFKLAKELNIQVFTTTHSNDCIYSFNKILKNPGHSLIGKYIRLDNVNGDIKQIGFSSEELDIAGQQEIEVR